MRVRFWPRHTEAFESFSAKPSDLPAIRNNKDILCLCKLYNWAMHSTNWENKETQRWLFIQEIRFLSKFSGVSVFERKPCFYIKCIFVIIDKLQNVLCRYYTQVLISWIKLFLLLLKSNTIQNFENNFRFHLMKTLELQSLKCKQPLKWLSTPVKLAQSFDEMYNFREL